MRQFSFCICEVMQLSLERILCHDYLDGKDHLDIPLIHSTPMCFVKKTSLVELSIELCYIIQIFFINYILVYYYA